MNRSVAQVARHYVKADRLTEPMLNRSSGGEPG